MTATLVTDEKFIPLWPCWKYHADSKKGFPKGRYQNPDEAKGSVRRAGYRAMYEFWSASSITPTYPTELPTPEAMFKVVKHTFPSITDIGMYRKANNKRVHEED